ncbi:MAG TPA: undecaprenyl-diphosphate phosphatase [Phycisphaerales bacterium]|nr:undecaprenyl-diphosphate phosphatase [Phycisphaerales bacterium]
MSPLQAVILGLIEGVTEFLPVSSTGHLIIASALMGLDSPERKASVDAFTIVVQGGAILAVLGLYRSRVLQMLRGVVARDDAGRRLLINLLVAFLPAAVLGVLLDDLIEAHLFRTGPVVAALALGGVWMIWLGKRDRAIQPSSHHGSDGSGGITVDALSRRQALAIGLMQCVAMWPGTSRSMMTIAGGVMLGMRRKDAAEFSFLLGLPTLGGACVYKLAKNLKESRDTGAPNLFEALGVAPVALGLVVAAVSAALAVKWLVAFLTRHGLAAFGWYRIALAGAVVVLAWRG